LLETAYKEMHAMYAEAPPIHIHDSVQLH